MIDSVEKLFEIEIDHDVVATPALRMPSMIRSRAGRGHETVGQVVVSLGEKGEGARLLSRMTRKSWAELGLAEGQSDYAQVKYVSLTPGRGELEG